MSSRKKSMDAFEANQELREELDRFGAYYDEDNPPPRTDRKTNAFANSRLPWLVDDFQGVTESVYEAVMVSAHRARQIGRRQKREIDAYNSSQVLTPESIEEEETAEKGIDHFNHIKPTIQALGELKEEEFEYYYLEQEKGNQPTK